MHNTYLYEVDAVENFTPTVSRIMLSPARLNHMNYTAGQYVNILLDQHASPLSIACAPLENGTLEFHLYHPEQNVRSRRLLEAAKKNREWQLSGPFGTCTINRLQLDKPIIFMARGTGFAPIKAVIEALSHLRQYPAMFLYWRMPSLEDFYLVELLKKWQERLASFRFNLVYKEEKTEQAQYDLLQKTILQNHPNLQNYQVYASGPAQLIYSAIATFEKNGLPRTSFYSDVF